MSLIDVINADANKIFLNGDFDVSIAYTPAGGSVKTIRAQIIAGVEDKWESGSADFNFEIREILISSVNNTEGHILPLECGRAGAGDTLVIASIDSRTWYVRKILEDGRTSLGMHRLLIADSLAAWPSDF